MKENIKNAVGVVAVILALILSVHYAYQIKDHDNYYPNRTITMAGEGKVTAKPDLATLSFSVVTSGKDPAKVQTENDAKMKTVIDYLKQNSVTAEDVQTSGYNLYPQTDYSKPNDPPSSYTLNQNVTVKIHQLESASTILGGLTGKGVNQINGITFSIDDPDKLKEQARELAVDKARAKAEELTKKIGVKISRVVNYSESENYPGPLFYDKGMGGGGGAPIQPGTQDVTINVTLTFELK